MVYIVSRFIFWLLLKIFCRFRSYGGENIPRSGPAIVASNHLSYLDPAIVGAGFWRKAHFMARDSLFKVFLLGRWMRAVGVIPLKRNSADFRAVREAVKRLKEGEIVAVFPEGTRSTDGNLQEGLPGLGIIAKLSHAPVIPAFIKGSGKILPRGSKFFKPARTTIYYGKPITLSGKFLNDRGKHDYRLFIKEVMRRIQALKDNHVPPTRWDNGPTA